MANYLTFSSAKPFTISIYNATRNWDGALYYSTDTEMWNEWDGTTAIASAEHGGEQRIYMHGVGNSVITGYDSSRRFVLTGTNIRCDGNIENLLDFETVESGKHPEMAGYCYYFMFYGCASLTKAPELPATTLADHCYYYMFFGCTSLTQAPELPATTLADGCYSFAFYNCTSLTQAPELPATTLASHCYDHMFYNCTSLTKAPELPATTLAEYCYYHMFSYCASLTKAPELPATMLADHCYWYMFYDCTSLKLSTAKTDEYNTEYRIPTSGDGVTAENALTRMFTGTGGTFTGTPEINTTYYMAVPEPVPVSTNTLKPSALIIGLRMGRMIAGTRCARAIPPDITEAVFENGVLYILNASATQSDHILEVK